MEVSSPGRSITQSTVSEAEGLRDSGGRPDRNGTPTRPAHRPDGVGPRVVSSCSSDPRHLGLQKRDLWVWDSAREDFLRRSLFLDGDSWSPRFRCSSWLVFSGASIDFYLRSS